MTNPRVTRVQEYCAFIAHACNNRRNIMFFFNALSNGQKRAKLSNTQTSLTWHVRPLLQNQKHVLPEQLEKSSLDNTCPGSAAWQACQTYNSHTYRGYLSRHRATLIHSQGPNKLTTFLLVKATTPNIRQTPSTRDNLLRHWTTSFACKHSQSLGAYILSTVHQIHLPCYVALRDTRQPSMAALA